MATFCGSGQFSNSVYVLHKGGLSNLRYLFAIPLILIGSLLIGLTNDDIGDKGNVMMEIIGWILFLVAIWIGRKKQVSKKQSSK